MTSPPSAKSRARLKKIAGYSAVYVAAFFFFLYVTFPYAVVQELIESQAKAAGLVVHLGSFGPGFFGATARQVKIALATPGIDDPPGLTIDSVAVRPALPFGLAIRASVWGGTAKGTVGLLRKKLPVTVRVSDVDLSRAGIKEAFGADIKGVLKLLTADVDVDPVDFTKAVGKMDLDLKEAVISGNLPKISAGDIEGEVKIEAGKATIEHFSVNGEDVEAEAEGTVTLNQRLCYSTPQLTAKFKLKPAFTERDEFAKSIKMILFQQFNANPDSRGFYSVALDGGLLCNPKYRFR